MRLLISLALTAYFAVSATASAENRVALIIGNDIYDNVANLTKAVADARAVRDTLEDLDFKVIYRENLGLSGMKQALFDFSAQLSPGDIGFFYYAGHGAELISANYLLPTDIPEALAPRDEAELAEEERRLAEFAVSEAFVVQRIKARGARVGVVVLDACRNNPLRVAETDNPFRATRPGDLVVGGTRGFVRSPILPEGIMAIYSANFGRQALDTLGPGDTNPNSPFTRVFIQKLATPGLGLRAAMLETRDEVVRLARTVDFEQRPALYDEVTGGDVFLNGEPEPQQAISEPIASDYNAAVEIGTVAIWDEFLSRHGDATDSFYVRAARSAREKLVASEILVPAVDRASGSAEIPPEVGNAVSVQGGDIDQGDLLVAAIESNEPEPGSDAAFAVAECDLVAADWEDTTLPEAVRGKLWSNLWEHRDVAIRWCQHAVEAAPQLARAHYQLGRSLHAAYKMGDALASYRRAAEMGHPVALYRVGYAYDFGDGVTADRKEALSWYEKAAALGNPSAISSIGVLYLNGLVVGGSRSRGEAYIQRATDIRKSLLERSGISPERSM